MKQNYYQIKCPYSKLIGEKFFVKYNKGLCSSCNKSLNQLNSNVYHMGCIHLFCSNCKDIKRNVLCTKTTAKGAPARSPLLSNNK